MKKMRAKSEERKVSAGIGVIAASSFFLFILLFILVTTSDQRRGLRHVVPATDKQEVEEEDVIKVLILAYPRYYIWFCGSSSLL